MNGGISATIYRISFGSDTGESHCFSYFSFAAVQFYNRIRWELLGKIGITHCNQFFFGYGQAPDPPVESRYQLDPASKSPHGCKQLTKLVIPIYRTMRRFAHEPDFGSVINLPFGTKRTDFLKNSLA